MDRKSGKGTSRCQEEIIERVLAVATINVFVRDKRIPTAGGIR